MSQSIVYSRAQFCRAINISAIFGWAGLATYSGLGVPFGLLIWATVFGLPISLLLCWVIGAPILKRAMRRPLGLMRAARWGGLIAFAMAALSIVLGRLNGWLQSRNPNRHSVIGGGDYAREIDGILTPYGWAMLGQGTAAFVALGMGVAVLVALIIGPPAAMPGAARENRPK